jgi:clusterin-associated protein 1
LKIAEVTIASKTADIKNAKNLATEITSLGATIYEFLGSEVELREARQKAVARLVESDDVEKAIKSTISSLIENINTLNQRLENLEADESNLKNKIEKKKADLERNKNRLKGMQVRCLLHLLSLLVLHKLTRGDQKALRPAYMDEYEKLEKELQGFHKVYLEKFRNLEFLEHELEEYNKGDLEKAAVRIS